MENDNLMDVNCCPLCMSDKSHHNLKFKVPQFFSNVGVVKCKECGLVFKSSIASEILKSKIYDDSYVHFAPVGNDDGSSCIERIKRMGCGKNKKHLDYGCGGGSLVRQALKMGWDSYGADCYLPDDVTRSDTGSHFIKSTSADEIINRFGKFDVISMWAVIEHLESPLEVFQGLSKCLNPGGKILFNAPSADSLVASRWGSKWRMALLLEHITFWTSTAITYVGSNAGLSIKKVRVCGTPFPFGTVEPSMRSYGLPDSFAMQNNDVCQNEINVNDKQSAQKKSFACTLAALGRKMAAGPVTGRLLRKVLEITRLGDHYYVEMQKTGES